MTQTATDARTSILDAAERLFSKRGFSATTIKMIAAESGQNSALIYYYYDSKASLYRHVLETRVIGRIQAEAAKRIGPETSPRAVITAIVESQVAVLTAQPTLSVLLSRELLDWQAAHAEPAIRSLSQTLFVRLRGAIEAGQQAGDFDAHINPTFAAISVIAQVAYLVLARPVAGILLGRGTDGPTADDLKAFGSHAAKFALAALSRPANDRRASIEVN